MGSFDRYPDSAFTPGTDSAARVCRFRPETNIRAVRITNGSYRSAPASGVFELYEPERDDPVEALPSGKRQVKVICAWCGGKPNWRASGARIDVSSPDCRVEVLEDYSGEVVDNIGYPTDPAPVDADVLPPPAADLASPPADRVKTTVSRIVRDTELANWVKKQHGHRCQLCGETIRLADGSGYAEGHHLQPLGKPHNGPDVAENIVCLCPNHHAACDLGAIQLTLDMLRQADNHKAGKRFIAYHNQAIFRGKEKVKFMFS
jgi:hypothetical protein